MSLRRLLDHYETPTGRVREWFMYDSETGRAAIQTEHDSAEAQRLASILTDQQTAEADGMRAERIIPSYVLDRAFAEGWFNDKAAWRRWANSSEGRVFAIEHDSKVKRL